MDKKIKPDRKITPLMQLALLVEAKETEKIKQQFDTYEKAIAEIYRLKCDVDSWDSYIKNMKKFKRLIQMERASKPRTSRWNAVIQVFIDQFPNDTANEIFKKIKSSKEFRVPIEVKGDWLYQGKDRIKVSGFDDRVSRIKKNRASQLKRPATLD